MIDRNARAIVTASTLMILALFCILGSRLRSANFYYPVTAQIKVYTDMSGKPLDGGYVYFGSPNQNPQSAPIQMYWDTGGTIRADQPFRTTNGYITRQGTPANVYAAGDFSSTVRDSAGRLVYTLPTSTDLQLALSIAGSSSAAAIPIADTGNYYSTDNVEAALQQLGPLLTQIATALAGSTPTGARIGYTGLTAPAGWVLADGLTIGNVASGATERANADTSNLYTLLWNSYANAQLAIQDSTGTATTRGASASNDFAANKRLSLPDYRGRTEVGLDNLGGTAANRITSGGSGIAGTTMGAAGGTETVTLTSTQIPSHTHTATVTDPGHTHTFTGIAHSHSLNFTIAAGSATASGSGIGGNGTTGSTTAGGTNSSNTTGISVANANTGGGGPHSVTQPTIMATMIIKL
jgi:microcystin-dependent protein